MRSSRFDDCARFLAAAQRGDPTEWPAAAARFAEAHGAVLARELLRFASLFFGFPPVLRALDLAADTLASRGIADPQPDPGDGRGDAGRRHFERVYQTDAPQVLARLNFLDPILRDWVLEHAYARGYSGSGLELLERERLAVIALAASGCWKQCDSHLRACRRLGWSEQELQADARAGDWLNSAQANALRERIQGLK